jgi:uncharacterized protein
MPRHLVLFVRAPALGRGKRRLAREIGDVAAVAFQRRMIALLLHRLASDARWRTRLAVTPDRAKREARLWRPDVPACGQGGGDLGRRMRRALLACSPGPAVLVGGDIPAIEGKHIERAFRVLRCCDLVFGPAGDGGFWLVGAKRPRQLPLFATAVRWSSAFALADTLAALPQGLRVGFADTLEDIDDAEAYGRFLARRGI